MTTTTSDYIDTRDLVEELSDLTGATDHWENYTRMDGMPDDDAERAEAIVALFHDISGYAGDQPEDGIQLIADYAFTDAMRELVEEIGVIPDSLPTYIAAHIDWEGVANDLRVDYTSVEFDGTTWWYR